ncbi:GFA family protein [Sphingomicrobium sediminis]|uniref:GFA family protein n=1 Tax=Sphingomicrobium sediminis TaxID=2950949 RepID=A0A9X2EEJ8_9SPHN|nr:GFA family protein [Sphingomicrobium sediminis]MCM8556488.1 GFA family protein [Sphingomicrobium sediminis]
MEDDAEHQRTGRCACGKVGFSVPDDPLIIHCCHCSYCQRETGSAFAINFLVEAKRVEWRGEPDIIDTPSVSGRGQLIFRCPDCGVALSSHYPSFGEALHFLRVGTFDDVSGIAPDVHIYTASKQDWVRLDDGAPTYEEYYRTRDHWDADKIGRLKKAMGK